MMKHFVLITGASEGLGKSFAIECAKRGMDLFLVSLPETGLPELSKLIDANFDIYVDYLELDLTGENSCQIMYDHVKEKNYPISFLINNAGVGGDYKFSNEGFEVFNRMIQLNIKALTLVTHKMLEVLKRRESSYILNVGSMAAHFEGPYKQVYGATKSFINYFSTSLSIELKHTNVHVSVLSPGGISSNVHHFRKTQHLDMLSKLTILDPEFVAAYAIRKCLKKNVEIIPGKLTKGYFLLSKILPRFIKEKMVKNAASQMFKSQAIFKKKPERKNIETKRLKESRV
jgi:uncharacterized protein